MKLLGLSAILLIAVASSALADTSYTCTRLVNGKPNPSDVINYLIDFNHGFFSGNTVTFSQRNTASGDVSRIIHGKVDSEAPGPNDPQDYEGNDYSKQSFLLISDSTGDPALFGQVSKVYISDDLVQKKSSGLALYEHEQGDFGGYDDHEFAILSCQQDPS